MAAVSNTVVKVEKVGKVFQIPLERSNSLKQTVIRGWKSHGYKRFQAIEQVDFEIKRGEFFGIIGQNGSGKSTLLKILAGIYTPTKGKVSISGRLSPFIELGVGFNPELTARENIYLNGAILGLKRAEVEKAFESIISFAELEEFVDQKLKNFSSGMLVRLAFSVAIRAHADILLIDEVLAVGDVNFQQKCFDIFRKFKAEGKTIIFVSHDLASIREFSDRVLLLNKGKSYGIFTPGKAIEKYSKINQERAGRALSGAGVVKANKDLEMPHLKRIDVFDDAGGRTSAVVRDKSMRVRLNIANPDARPLDVGVAIYRKADGFYCFGTNTNVDKFALKPGKEMTVEIEYPNLPLMQGIYQLTVGIFDPGAQQVYEMNEGAFIFQVMQTDGAEGITYVEHKWREVKEK